MRLPFKAPTQPDPWSDASSADAGDATSSADHQALARLLGRQYLAGALVMVIAVLLPAPDESDEPYLLAFAAAALIIGTGLHFVSHLGLVNAGIAALVVLVSGVAAVAQPLGLTPLFYFWPLTLSAYYSSTRLLTINTAFAIGALAGVLAVFSPVIDPAMTLMQFAAVSIVIVIAVHRLRQRVDQLFTELKISATHDALTGALNRGAFEESFAAWHGASHRRASNGSLLLLDIDHFKTVNDTFGHPAGDAALRRLVRIVGKEIRETDVLGRVGGEEFAVLLPATGTDEALVIAERIRGAVAEHSGDGPRAFTVSIGLADSGEVPQPWDAADRALYAAKRAGRNRVVVAEDSPPVALCV